MSEVDLDTAVVAARRVAEAAASDGAATRLRIRETLAQRRGPGRRMTIIAALIASLFGSTAFAYFAGWRPPWSDPSPVAEPANASITSSEPARRSQPAATRTEDKRALPTEPRVPARRAPGRPADAIAPPVPPHTATAPDPATTAIATVTRAPITSSGPTRIPDQAPAASRSAAAPPAVRDPDESPPAAPRSSVAPSALSAADERPRTAPLAPDPELAAYRVAHEAHFRASDAAAALAAWDAYLAAFPSGRLALDARYNRGIVLIKLKRFADARAALRPFASAPAGAYRQAEAAKLLGALPP